jgi:hypothetical protein
VATSALGNAVRDMIVSVTQSRLLLEMLCRELHRTSRVIPIGSIGQEDG